MKSSRIIVLTVIFGLLAASLSAYVLLSPRRTWDGVPNLIVDSRGNATIGDGNGGTTRIRDAINASISWNGAGSGTNPAGNGVAGGGTGANPPGTTILG